MEKAILFTRILQWEALAGGEAFTIDWRKGEGQVVDLQATMWNSQLAFTGSTWHVI